jgi:GDP-4-dehydro-6-deoxy-D-mannose reductase
MGMKRVLITGARGFTGRHACRFFAASGWDVVAVSSGRRSLHSPAPPATEDRGREECGPLPPLAPGGAEEGRSGGLREAVCDLTDREAVRRLVRDAAPDAVLHLAGQNAVDRSWREPDLTLAANALSTAYLLQAFRECREDGRALVIGSMLREPPEAPSHPYAFSKAVQASTALAWHRWYGLQVLVAEPCNLIGPGGSGGICGKIARWAAEAEAAGPAGFSPFKLSSLTEQRDYLDVRDAVRAYEILLRRGAAGTAYPFE